MQDLNSVEIETVKKDVSTTADNFFSSVRTRSAIESEPRYTKFPKLECVPPQLEMDYSVILNKPFFIKNITWTSTTLPGVTLATLNIPSDILSNPLVRVPFNASVYYRARVSVVFQVAGTPMHSGLLIASALPNGGDKMWQETGTLLNMNKFMAAPHVFLSANESTPVILEVPFYVNSKLQPITINGTSVSPSSGDYAEVVLTVVNAMGVPTSGTTALTISAHFMFNELEFYAPHVDPVWVAQSDFRSEAFIESAKGFVTSVFDRITSGTKTTISDAYDLISSTKVHMFDFVDSGRSYLRSLTGLHNPADATVSTKMATQTRQNTNVVDAPLQIEKLDPYSQFSHYTRDYTFDTDIDEMLISEIVSKPQYIATFGLKSVNTEGTILFSRPITPFQEINRILDDPGTGPVVSLSTTSLLQNIHFMSRYWRGGLKLHIQSVMSNFHYCKLTVARNYSPDTNMITSVPAFASVPNLMMETLEFTGHQVHTIDLPFISPMEQLPCTTDMLYNALQHAMYYIYVHQPLVVNGSVPTSVSFNVYISGAPDLQFFGYASRPLYVSTNIANTPIFSMKYYNSAGELIEPDETIPEVEVETQFEADTPVLASYGVEPVVFKAESHVEDQQNVLLHENEQTPVKPSDLRPIVSVRDYGRRWTRAFYKRYTPTELTNFDGGIQLDVASLIGVRGETEPSGSPPGIVLRGMNSAKLINSMFLGYSGGARFKVSVLGSTISECYYVPPGFHNYNLDVTGNREWRSTAPFPNLNTAPYNTAYYSANNAQYLYAEKTDNPFARTDLLSMCPMQDKPNYVVSSDNLDVGIAGAEFQRLPMLVSTHEVEVPHMSPFRFVGNSSKGYHPSLGNYAYHNANNNMGYLVIKLAQPVLYYPSVTPISPSIALEVFSSFDDVGRAGYQVFAPTTIIPAVLQSAGGNFNYYQIGTDSILSTKPNGFFPGYLSSPAQSVSSIVPAYDYTKSLYKTVT